MIWRAEGTSIMNSIYIKTFLILFSAILVAGCGAAKQQAMLDTVGSPQQRPATFDALREDFDRADKAQVKLISPEKYASAKKSFEAAEAMQSQGQPEEKYNEKLSSARENLDSAMAFAKDNKDRMSPLIEARETALTSGAAETTNKDLKELEQKYLVLVSDLDSRNSRKEAFNRIPELTEDYQKLTIKTLQAKYLGEAKNNLELAKREGAKDLVPKTLKETEELIQKANASIGENQKDPMLSKLSSDASLASRRLLALTRQTKASKGLSAEDVSLKTEAGLKSADQESAKLQTNLTESQKQNVKLESKTKKYAELEQQDEKNKKFESVRELFDDSEAKVYRQGSSLVISLKKINFAVNKSEIPSPSFALLKKVQSAIRSFEEPSVVVEGHTDSTGDSLLNKELSERRAEAVKAYLLSNNTTSQEKISAVGYGSEKPLASNKLSAGRAINRRIDIVIKD
jgi:OOP family OmpA-OmpF porin